jgi:hypothetical protein
MSTVKTTVINLFGGPGCGKSTTAAGLFFKLKVAGKSVELVREYVKAWAWQNRTVNDMDAIYLLGKQSQYESSLYGKVEYIVTDSPILLAGLYPYMNSGVTYVREAAEEFVRSCPKNVIHKNFLLKRTKQYDPRGRWGTEQESILKDMQIKEYLQTRAHIDQHHPRAGYGCTEEAKVKAIMEALGL